MSYDNPFSSANRPSSPASRPDKSSSGRPAQTQQLTWDRSGSRQLTPLATSDLSFSSQQNKALPFATFQAGAKQSPSVPAGPSFTSPRSGTVTPLSYQANTASASHFLQGGLGAGGGAGLNTGGKSGTYSPSLSGTNIGPPTTASFERTFSLPGSANSSSGQSSLTKISVAQVLLLLDTISEKQGKAKWETKAEQIKKVVRLHKAPQTVLR